MEQKIHRDIFLTDFPKNGSLNTKEKSPENSFPRD